MKQILVFIVLAALTGKPFSQDDGGYYGYTGYKGYAKYNSYAGYQGYGKKISKMLNINFTLKDYFLNTPYLEVRNYIIAQAEASENTPPELALEIAYHESGLDPNAKSPTTAVGVFQFIESTWIETMERMGRPQYKDLKYRYDFKLNIEAGIWLMEQGEYWHWYPYSGQRWAETLYKYFPEIQM
jgi:soluble lytic murein transglycosylase-like protein